MQEGQGKAALMNLESIYSPSALPPDGLDSGKVVHPAFDQSNSNEERGPTKTGDAVDSDSGELALRAVSASGSREWEGRSSKREVPEGGGCPCQRVGLYGWVSTGLWHQVTD